MSPLFDGPCYLFPSPQVGIVVVVLLIDWVGRLALLRALLVGTIVSLLCFAFLTHPSWLRTALCVAIYLFLPPSESSLPCVHPCGVALCPVLDSSAGKHHGCVAWNDSLLRGNTPPVIDLQFMLSCGCTPPSAFQPPSEARGCPSRICACETSPFSFFQEGGRFSFHTFPLCTLLIHGLCWWTRFFLPQLHSDPVHTLLVGILV